MNAVSATGFGSCLEGAAEDRHPLPHADEAVPTPVARGRRGSSAIVVDEYVEGVIAVIHCYRCRDTRASMLNRVCQGLLDDAKRRELDTVGKGPTIALDGQLDGHPG